MTVKNLEILLQRVLFNNWGMEYELYKYELEGQLEELADHLVEVEGDYLFMLTENNGYMAMVLLENTGAVHINEKARDRLRALWPKTYTTNLQQVIPFFAKQLHAGGRPLFSIEITGNKKKR